ncbi:MFS transporter [Nonomuraea sp. K274]|uniref:MFS transporter n=1 Tax=Nonomuraea cypriaca TaxID=1187855 RepID=A0A931EUQ5_9ACTN|nr:MFS transporter [Nonomuraea cypriaca]MBF8184804.1 MFS transporter [Nonomuraea cypriaca]
MPAADSLAASIGGESGPLTLPGRPSDSDWRLVTALAVTQTIGFGVLYYSFSVLLTPMSRDLGASASQVSLALTTSVLIAALGAPLAGRWLDARGGRALMTAGSVLGTLALLAWSQVHTVAQLYAVFVAVGVASAMVLYEAAFAVIVARFAAPTRATALLALTAVAGFASTIFMPLTGALTATYGWRQALIILALLYGTAAIPLHALAVRRPLAGRIMPSAPTPTSAATSVPAPLRSGAGERAALVRTATRQAAFWLLAAAFTLHGIGVSTISVLLITCLIHLGHPPLLAASVAGLLGILSVTGRLITTGLQRRLPAALLAAAIFALQAVAAAALPLVGATTTGAVAAVLLFGLGFGVGTITKPHLLTERWGTTAYASLSGRLALPATVAKAVSPAAALAVAQVAGYGWVMAAVTLACLVAAAALVGYHRLSFRRTSNHPSVSEAPA